MTKALIDELAFSLGRRDEAPNIALAVKIAKTGNEETANELFSLIDHKTASVRSDAIKVVYELAERNIGLVLPFVEKLVRLLDHKDNRMRWGAMSALSAISLSKPERLVPHLTKIVQAMDEGSVITRDHGMIILSQIASIKKYHRNAMELMLEQIEKAPVNQMPSYAEKTASVISAPFIPRLEKILHSRNDVMEIASKQKRILKLLKEFSGRTKRLLDLSCIL